MYIPFLWQFCVSLFCYALLCVHSSFEDEEKASCFTFIVLQMSCYCKCSVALPHGAWVGLQCVIVVFHDHTHLLFDSLRPKSTIFH